MWKVCRVAQIRKFCSITDVLKASREDRAHLFLTTVLEVMAYGCEMWSPTEQRKMYGGDGETDGAADV